MCLLSVHVDGLVWLLGGVGLVLGLEWGWLYMVYRGVIIIEGGIECAFGGLVRGRMVWGGVLGRTYGVLLAVWMRDGRPWRVSIGWWGGY